MKNDTCTLSLTTRWPSAAVPGLVFAERVCLQPHHRADGLESPVPTLVPHLWQGHRDMYAVPFVTTQKSFVQFIHLSVRSMMSQGHCFLRTYEKQGVMFHVL